MDKHNKLETYILENNQELFLDVCIKNDIDFVKYLYEIEPNFNLSIDECKYFIEGKICDFFDIYI